MHSEFVEIMCDDRQYNIGVPYDFFYLALGKTI